MTAREMFGWVCTYLLLSAAAVLLVAIFILFLITTPILALGLVAFCLLMVGALWGLE